MLSGKEIDEWCADLLVNGGVHKIRDDTLEEAALHIENEDPRLADHIRELKKVKSCSKL